MTLTASQRAALVVLADGPASTAGANAIGPHGRIVNAASASSLETRGLAESFPDPAYERANRRGALYWSYRITAAGRAALDEVQSRG